MNNMESNHIETKPIVRSGGRQANTLRPVTITRGYNKHAEGSVLICCGDTQIICTATIEERVPRFLRGKKQGWISAEYGMLPRSTGRRLSREAGKGGRTMEIQRLIARSLRAVADLKILGERMITLDCDVIQADGSTRTAAITGAYVALIDAVHNLERERKVTGPVIPHAVAAVSVGMVDGVPLLDLDFSEDSRAETDMNVIMNSDGDFIELQGTAEQGAFQRRQLNQMLDLAELGVAELLQIQKNVLAESL